MTALEVSLFDCVADGASTPAALAKAANISERGAQGLMHAISALGLLDCRGSTYALSSDAERYLVSGKPEYLGDMHKIFYGMNARLWPQLTQAVRSGQPIMDLFVADENRHWDDVFPFLNAVSRPMVQAIATYIAQTSELPKKVLDVGAGAGFYSCEITKTDPLVSTTSIDQPEVLPYLQRAVEQYDLAERVSVHAGDIFAIDWSGPHDFVLFSHLLHGFDLPSCATLVTKAFEALTPGGELLIHEFITDPVTPQERPLASFFNLPLLMTSTGGAYTTVDYDRLLTDVGFEPSREIPTPGGATRVLSAKKPH
jgi:SAM-dependent methyltransferase